MILSTQIQKGYKRLIEAQNCQIEEVIQIFKIASKGDFIIKNAGIFVSVFFENSTRTLLSFEIAAKNCGFNVVRFEPESSSIKKEETEENTIKTIASMSPSAIAIRCKKSGQTARLAKFFNKEAVVINAGDGTNEHPTQGLLDFYTILQHLKVEPSKNCLKGIKVGIMGDVMHSRVARSNIFLLTSFGAEVHLICPPNFLSQNFADFYAKHYGCKIFTSYKEKVDFLMLLRVQKERMEGSGIICYPSGFGIFKEEDLKGAMLMHPGPINEGVEVSKEVAFGSQSLISKQVENGVLIRSAILKFLHG